MFGLNDVLRAIRSGRWFIVGGVALGLLASGVMISTAERTYVSSSELFVSVGRTPDAPAAYQGALLTQERMPSYARMLSTTALAQRVVDELGDGLTASQVASKVSAVPFPKSDILQITVTDTSPERATAIADSLGRQFASQVAARESSNGASGPTIEVTANEPATFDPTPVSPKPARTFILGGALGLLLGLVLAILRQRLDRAVRTPREVEQATGTALVSRVYEDRRLTRLPLPQHLDGPSPVAKAFRALGLNLENAAETRPRVLVVTSAAPGEGKSTVAVGLSLALVRSGRRVLLVDCNLWQPRLAKYLGVAAGELGLADVLAGSAGFRDAIVPTDRAGLAVLPAGPMPEDPGELLGSPQMRALLGELREFYDYVIVDTTALLPVVDAAAVSALGDGCLLVTRHGRTRRDELREAATALAAVGTRVVGVVLNRVPQGVASPGSRRTYKADQSRRRPRGPGFGPGGTSSAAGNGSTDPAGDPEPDVLAAEPGGR